MKNLCFWLILLLLAGSSIKGYSQQSGLLSGKLQDEAGVPIPYANVAVLKVADSSLVTGAVTNEEGVFAIKSPATGSYLLRLSAIGFEEKKTPVFEVANNSFSREFGAFSLKEEVKTLNEVTVKALRPTVMVEADRIVVSVEGSALAAGSTAFEVLARAPGVWVDQNGNVQLHGKSGVQVMIDGRLTYLSAKDLQTMLQGMSAENIKNIEIISNPSAKYDAEGAAGIININLKKEVDTGLNGSLYGGYQFNGLHTYSSGGNLNFKKGRWNSYATVDMAERAHQRIGEFTRVFNEAGNRTFFNQEVLEDVKRFSPSLRLGTDVNLNSRHSIGAMVNLSYQKNIHDWGTHTYLRTQLPSEDLLIDADYSLTNSFENRTFNLHYLAKLDTLESTFSANLDFVRLSSAEEAGYLNQYDSLAMGRMDFSTLLTSENPTSYDIYSARLDYSKSYKKGSRLELGAKASRLVSDNALRFFFNEEEGKILDPDRSNHFIYEESIYAAYGNFSTSFGKQLKLQAGLRAEQTVASGYSLTLNQALNRKYLDLFPSLFVQQKVSENYQVNYNYSRRIQRPDYELLNPFKFYLDPFTWAQGNPYLRPMYTHSFGITQAFMQSLHLSLNYSLTKDFIAEVPFQNVEDKTTIFNRENVDDSQNLSTTFMAPLKIIKNWDTNNRATVAWQYFSMPINGTKVENEAVFYMFQSTHNILLPKNYQLEVDASYMGPQAWGLYQVEDQWWVNLGVKKSFMNEKVDLSLNMNDIFRSRWTVGNANVEGNTNGFKQYLSSQSIGLTLRYRFSKGEKFELGSRDTSLEEVERAGGN